MTRAISKMCVDENCPHALCGGGTWPTRHPFKYESRIREILNGQGVGQLLPDIQAPAVSSPGLVAHRDGCPKNNTVQVLGLVYLIRSHLLVSGE